MDKYIGKRLDGRYEIRELVGVGGMANVYKAFDIVENRLVAVKVLRDEYMDNEEFLRRFRNESKAVASLSHEHIVKVYDVSFSQKMHSIVMEYIDGVTLKEYIDQRVRLSWKETVAFTEQILRALQHAHDNGIVHRDIKPQNMMLLADGNLKVTDFGIARFARSVTKTITDRAIGSVHYISPEQAQGGTIDEKTDIYSVGVMMYEMLTGRLPFDADSPVTVAIKQIQSEPPMPTRLNPDIPEGLETITMRAMQKDPTRRYQSAAEMLRDIGEFKKNPSIDFAYKYLAASGLSDEERPTGTLAGNRPRRSGTTGAIGAIGANGANGSMGAGSETRQMPRAMPPPLPPEPEKRGLFGRRKRDKNQEEQMQNDDYDYDYDEEEHQRIPYLSVLTGITVAFVLVSAIFVGTMFYFNNPFEAVESVKVPTLVGKKFDMVKYDNTLTDLGISVRVEQTEFNDKYDNGVIFEQNPRAGREMKAGATIDVKVSAGSQKSTMMDLVGMEADEAYDLLRSKGIENHNEMRVNHDTIPEGQVVSTEPEANAQVDQNTEVVVYVSMGRKNLLLPVPDVKGININEAKRLLKNYRLSIGTVTPQESELGVGVIISQTPEAGVEVPEGSVLDVTISSGNGELSRLSIGVIMPKITTPVTVEAWLDSSMIHEGKLIPADVEGGSWKQVYEGSGILPLVIRINGQLYQSYEVNFAEGKHRLVTDNSALFASGVPTSVPEPPVDTPPAADPEAAADAPPESSAGADATPDGEEAPNVVQ